MDSERSAVKGAFGILFGVLFILGNTGAHHHRLDFGSVAIGVVLIVYGSLRLADA